MFSYKLLILVNVGFAEAALEKFSSVCVLKIILICFGFVNKAQMAKMLFFRTIYIHRRRKTIC